MGMPWSGSLPDRVKSTANTLCSFNLKLKTENKMGSYEDFMKAWNYIWHMGNEVIEYTPFLAERDVPKTDKLHEELIKLKAAFEDAQEEWWTQHNEKRRKDEEWATRVTDEAENQET